MQFLGALGADVVVFWVLTGGRCYIAMGLLVIRE